MTSQILFGVLVLILAVFFLFFCICLGKMASRTEDLLDKLSRGEDVDKEPKA